MDLRFGEEKSDERLSRDYRTVWEKALALQRQESLRSLKRLAIEGKLAGKRFRLCGMAVASRG
jgi:hypothetical protein